MYTSKLYVIFLLFLLPILGLAQVEETLIAKYGGSSLEANTWHRFSIPLTAETFSTDPATFSGVMANVKLFRIGTEMSNSKDVGGVDEIHIGSRFNSNFDSDNAGWNAAGDGTMEWIAAGGVTGGFLQISDWGTGDYHYAVAPLSWTGDWSDLIGDSLTFYYKTNYPDYTAEIQLSSVPQKRLVLAARQTSIAPGGSIILSVTLSEPTETGLTVNLSSSALSCFISPFSMIIAQNQTFAEFEVIVPEDAEPGCFSVIEATATGYGASRVTLNVQAPPPSTGTLTGHITDATTGAGIPGATVSIAGITTTTDADGAYTIEEIPTNLIKADFDATPRNGTAPLLVQFNDLSDGSTLRLTASADGYSTSETLVTLEPGGTTVRDVSLSPNFTDSELRIVLNWGEQPIDLDLHLDVPGEAGGSPYEIYYSNQGAIDEHPYAILDTDDTNGYGPETVTIAQFVDGRYICYVHNYRNDAPLADCKAVVQIYGKSGLLQSISVPNSGNGVYWYLCDIDGATQQVTVINSIVTERPRLGGVHGMMKLAAKTDQSSIPGITSWAWDFDDDGTVDATTQNPSHTYSEPGQYTVSLTVSDGTTEYTERKENFITVTENTSERSDYRINITGIDISNFPLVRCFTTVTDAVLNMPTENLIIDNFVVTEDGDDVLSLSVNPLSVAAEASADIVFVFDITGSMSDEIETLKERSLAFADSLAARGIDYRLGLVTFSDNVEAIHDFTADANEFKTWISGLVATGGGDTNENALEGIESATRLSFRSNSQRIAILITDADYHEAGESGDGTTDQTTDSIIEVLNDDMITLNVVGPQLNQHKTLADNTGGQYYLIFGDFSDIITRLGDALTKQYVITYVTPNNIADNTWRNVGIEVQKNGGGGFDDGDYFISGSQLVMTPPTILGRKDNTFELQVRVESVSDLGMAYFEIAFDNTKLEALNVFEGDFFDGNGGTGAYVREIKNSTGIIEISASRLASGGSPGVSGSGLLATLAFRVLVDESDCQISFQNLDVRHPDNSALSLTTSGAVVRSFRNGTDSDLLCDFDDDFDIDTRDFAFLATYWKPGNSPAGDVGPADGGVPLLTPLPDTKVNYEDLFVFTRMWNWYHSALYAETGLGKVSSTLSLERTTHADEQLTRYVVQLDNVANLGMGHVTIHYNAGDFDFESAKAGVLLTPDDSDIAFLVEEERLGTLDITFSRLTAVGQPAAINGSGALMTLDFKAKNPAVLNFRVENIDFRTPGNTQIAVSSSIDNTIETDVQVPTVYAMSNYPNPFNSRTTIEFQLPEDQDVTMDVINILGQPVRTVTAQPYKAGVHKLVWDGKNDQDAEVVTGTYFVRMQAGQHQVLRKILYLK